MTEYALLVLPAANRVYADATPALTRAELGAVLGDAVGAAAETTFGGVSYVTFTADLAPDAIAKLSNLSSVYALFAREGELLRPVELTPLATYDDDLITIPKYAGKTNEHFTKLLLNVTVAASAFATAERKLHVFDPLCGRGTTLNQALMYGWDATGMDVDGKDFDAYAAFLKTWLRRKRLKHRADITPVRRERKTLGRRLDVTVSATPELHKAGVSQSLTVVNADTLLGRDVFRASAFDLIVADAPYGVQHGSRAAGQSSLSRSPLDLLRKAVPIWVELLRAGGAIGLSWNTHVAPRTDVAELFASSGLTVRDEPPYDGFRHWVDQSIDRDIVVAVKTR
ncbi:TRM11 family SAM-dependent methyltransferase [Tenggerimyces flavus]|uniref:TRM11 family SAM-dependent methyltransferase n=1 Tax=Tenggerimyces flavus TaxID=1708749 RepID=A0ABV7Y5D5_9ACTN|nr:SAM-dependent methyltransferase [Tenggerimyces flavus]MBM7791040.1 SAM-dependent methyltransferase [Tenggerimyces flavus]